MYVGLNGKPKDPAKPLRRCGEWVEEAIDALVEEGVLEQAIDLSELK